MPGDVVKSEKSSHGMKVQYPNGLERREENVSKISLKDTNSRDKTP